MKALLALGLSLALSAAEGPAFQVAPPGPILTGTFQSLRLSGLPPGAEVRLRAERLVQAALLGGKRLLFRSEATYTSGPDGTLDLAKAAPRSGSYRGADVRGLLWSMAPTQEPVPPGARTGRVRLLAQVGGRDVAETTLAFASSLLTVRTESVAAFPGAVLASLPGEGKRPVIILLGGAEGGSRAAQDEAPKLASQGFAVLGLPYYSPAQLPGGPREIPALPADFADIPVERLDAVRAWVQSRPDLDGDRIALYGASKGAEFALLAACHLPWVRAVVAVAPSDVVWEGWGFGLAAGTRSSFSLRGKPFPFVPYQDFAEEFIGFSTGAEIRLRRPHDKGRAAHPAAAVAARIPAERYRGPLMLVAGHDDQLWNAGMMAQNIAERRAQAGLETLALIYPEAGHYLNGDGCAPTTHYNLGQEKSGGTPAGNARAQAEAWPRMVAFLRQHLGAEGK